MLTDARMKDHDVTWLYGPLQIGSIKTLEFDSTPPASQLSRSNSFTSKKPILKKRTLSELMLQRSLTSSTLIKQATDAVRAQQPVERVNDRSIGGDHAQSNSVKPSNPGSPSLKLITAIPTAVPSASTSGAETPSTKRHIHFNNKVEQCIAINECSVHNNYYNAIYEDSSSEEDMLMMKPVHSNRPALSRRSTPRGSFSNESKTIAMLPSTTLNYRGDVPDFTEKKPKQNGSIGHLPPKPSLACSQKTLERTESSTNSPSQSKYYSKPTTSSFNFLMDDEDEDIDICWEPLAGRNENLDPYQWKEPKNNSISERSSELRQTPSGIFMAPERTDDGFAAAGLFDKVLTTVNTAKDIAHVIWNVGWRK